MISQAQAIKSEMTAVEAKVNRSVALLRSLSDERSRWQDTSNAFQAQMGTIVGDVMLSSAFLAYAGTCGTLNPFFYPISVGTHPGQSFVFSILEPVNGPGSSHQKFICSNMILFENVKCSETMLLLSTNQNFVK